MRPLKYKQDKSVQDKSADPNPAPICDGNSERRWLNQAREKEPETKTVTCISFRVGEEHQREARK
jgi:hypothetical protein